MQTLLSISINLSNCLLCTIYWHIFQSFYYITNDLLIFVILIGKDIWCTKGYYFWEFVDDDCDIGPVRNWYDSYNYGYCNRNYDSCCYVHVVAGNIVASENLIIYWDYAYALSLCSLYLFLFISFSQLHLLCIAISTLLRLTKGVKNTYNYRPKFTFLVMSPTSTWLLLNTKTFLFSKFFFHLYNYWVCWLTELLIFDWYGDYKISNFLAVLGVVKSLCLGVW